MTSSDDSRYHFFGHGSTSNGCTTAQEPRKAAQLASLKGAPPPPRIAFCVVQVPLPGVGYVFEADVELSAQPVRVIGWRKVRRQLPKTRPCYCAFLSQSQFEMLRVISA